jgi:26S proteasome regulatory subunit N10
MPLESTMLCLDNSDWMRNGDYLPCRLDAQHDAAGVICNDRVNSNPESTVGILTMAGQGYVYFLQTLIINQL